MMKNKKFNNQNGQALFEMILFLPFLIFLYTIFYTAGNSISGSINQQKAVRSYFYNRLKGNSYIVSLPDLRSHLKHAVTKVGFTALGWNDYLDDSNKSFAPCFKFSSILKNGSEETCDSDEREEPGSSRFIRLFTFYGVCGAYYTHSTDMVDSKDFFDINPRLQALTESCTTAKD